MPLLNTPLQWGRAKLRDNPQMILGGRVGLDISVRGG